MIDLLADFPFAPLATGFGLCLLISALGFLRVDWFISIGYGFSIAALALLFAVWFGASLTPISILQLLLLLAYGLRLAGYLVLRERAQSFSRELTASRERSRGVVGPAKFAIWISVSLLYVAMASPAAFALASGATGLFPVLGVIVMALGLVLELSADAQKSAAKAKNPDAFVSTGLFAMVRYPNYLGEMIFWLGNFICALSVYTSLAAWLVALVGLVCIELIMLGSARRLEIKQGERYGTREDYRAYVRRVPILFPFVPLRSLRNLKIYLG